MQVEICIFLKVEQEASVLNGENGLIEQQSASLAKRAIIIGDKMATKLLETYPLSD